MLKYFLLLIFIFHGIFIFSQKKGIELKVGLEYRITPIENSTSGIEVNDQIFHSKHKQLTGTAINYSIAYFFKGIGVGISQSLQYSHIYYDSNNTNLNNKSINGLINDFKFFIEKDFEFQRIDIFIEIGTSIMNNGTSYFSRDLILAQEGNGENLYYLSERDFGYFANNITLGVKFQKIDFSLGSYFSKGYNETNYPKKFSLPYFKINCILL